MSEEVLQWWGFKEGGGDPVTSTWAGVESVIYPLITICLYLTLVTSYRNSFIKSQWQLRPILVIYNAFQVALSAYIFSETLLTAYDASYNIWCEPPHSTVSTHGRRMAVASWLFYISKYIDLLDTFFMIVKGNVHQISVLHVFHHSSMILNSWFGIRFVPTGHSFFIHLSNSFVHVIMYSYYLLSSLGSWIKPYLWWKPYLTQVQILQFFLMWIHMAVGLYNNCPIPMSLIVLVLAYLILLIFMFLNFYFGAYASRKHKKQA